jgi:ribosomal biogenesis protein LAS1
VGCRRVHANWVFRLGDSLDDTRKEWNTVLLKVAESHPAFLRHLTEDLVNELAFNETKDVSTNPRSEALYLWLAHILTSSTWEFHRQSCPQSYVLQVCDESSHHWTKLLGDQVKKEAGKAKVLPVARSAGKNRVSKPIPRTVSRSTTTQLSAKLLEHGWGLLEKWDSRPLGVVASN